MMFNKWIFVFSLFFLIACGDNKKPTRAKKSNTEIESTYNEVENSQVLEENEGELQPKSFVEVTEELQIQEGESTELKKTDVSQASYKCNISNYQEYVYDFQKVNQLVAETGAGCYLPGVDFSNQDLKSAVFTKANLTGAIFIGANLKGTKFIGADLTNAVLEDTNYMEAYFRSAILTGTRYNEYDSITAWIKVFSGQGIRDPESKGMIYTGQ